MQQFLVSADVTHPLFVQLQQGVPDLGGVWGQAKAVQVQFRHDELQQPLGRQASRGCVTSGRRHWFLKDGTSQCLHLRRRFTFIRSSQIHFTHTETLGEIWRGQIAGLPLWYERWFCNCTELRWILLFPPDGNWWPLDRGGRPCRRNSGVLWWQYSHINITVKNNDGSAALGQKTVTVLGLKYDSLRGPYQNYQGGEKRLILLCCLIKKQDPNQIWR